MRTAAFTIAVIATLLAGVIPGALAAPAHRVLVLFSNSRVIPGNIAVDRGLRDVLADSPTQPVQLSYEYLDSPEFSGEAHERTVRTYLHEKYAGRLPEVLLAFSDAAFEFLARNRAALFPGVPLVYGSVSPAVLSLYTLTDDVVGVPIEYDFAGTIDQALRWHPNAERLVVVTGTSPRDKEWEARLRKEAPSVARERSIEYWAGLPTPQLNRQLADLDPRTVVFTPGYYIDGAGAISSPGQTAAVIGRVSNAPVYGPLDTFIGTGIVGGRMPSFEGVGRQTGAIIARIVAGEEPAASGANLHAPILLHVDWRQVKRFGIDESDIPRDAVIHFREATFWEQYRVAAIIAASIILIQAGLIASLLIERRRRRAAELVAQKHRIELAHASRLAVAGELTASIAHEINQPLAAVRTSADAAHLLLQSKNDSRADLQSIVTRIRRESVRASDVIRRLRTLLARHAPEMEAFRLEAALNDVASLMATEAKRRGVVLNVLIAAPDTHVLGDETQIEQVLINLVMNAMDAVANLDSARREILVSTELADGQVHVLVHDRGHGIAPKDLPHVFESFFTTKQDGMGLGLSIVRTILEAHGGSISAESTVGVETKFRVQLPLSHGARVAQ
jgi:signal transduction histidine kinase